MRGVQQNAKGQWPDAKQTDNAPEPKPCETEKNQRNERHSRATETSTMPGHIWDLEERTAALALAVRAFTRQLPMSVANTEDSKQLIRSSGSVPANCIEA